MILKRLLSILPKSPPSQFNVGTTPPPQYHLANQPTLRPSSTGKGLSIHELVSLLGMCTLAYLALDNYNTRVTLEKAAASKHAQLVKVSRSNQALVLAERKKRHQIETIRNKKETRRSLRMATHIALLRKQLVEAGLDPISIDQSLHEFKNSAMQAPDELTGLLKMWISDNSRMCDSSEYSSGVTKHYTNLQLSKDMHQILGIMTRRATRIFGDNLIFRSKASARVCNDDCESRPRTFLAANSTAHPGTNSTVNLTVYSVGD